MLTLNKFVVFLALLACLSCEETIILDTQQIEPKIVIQSHITSEHRHQAVKLGLSVGFYYSTEPPVIKDAVVSVTDVTENITYLFNYAESDNPANHGVYFSEDPFQGVVGHTYRLEVDWNGVIYSAEEEMLPVTAIDSMAFRINPLEFQDPDKEGYYYEALLYAQEPQQTTDYYYFKFYRNDSLIYADETDVYFSDDKLLGERIADVATPIFYRKNDVARVHMYSVTRPAYIYLNDLFNVLNNDSGMFSPPPANPRNNLSNGALGYFMVSDVSTDSIVID